MTNLLTTKLHHFQKRISDDSLTNYRLYLFGSSLYKSNPNDVDILIVYQRKDLAKVLQIRNDYREGKNSDDIYFDIILLTEKEFLEFYEVHNFKMKEIQC